MKEVVYADKIVPADTHTHYNYEAEAIVNSSTATPVWKNPATYADIFGALAAVVTAGAAVYCTFFKETPEIGKAGLDIGENKLEINPEQRLLLESNQEIDTVKLAHDQKIKVDTEDVKLKLDTSEVTFTIVNQGAQEATEAQTEVIKALIEQMTLISKATPDINLKIKGSI